MISRAEWRAVQLGDALAAAAAAKSGEREEGGEGEVERDPVHIGKAETGAEQSAGWMHMLLKCSSGRMTLKSSCFSTRPCNTQH